MKTNLHTGGNYLEGVGYLRCAGSHLPNVFSLTPRAMRPEFSSDEFQTIDARDSIVSGSCRLATLSETLSFPVQNYVLRGAA